MKYEVIWYNLEKEITRDNIEASDENDARQKAYIKYNGTPPEGSIPTIIPKGGC